MKNKKYSDNKLNTLNACNLFNKKLRALKKYCPQTYKYLIFQRPIETSDGMYELDLPTSFEFKFIYGQIKIIYEVKNGVPFFKDLEPSQFFIDGYNFDLNIYKNIYYRNPQDKFKIDLMYSMKELRSV